MEIIMNNAFLKDLVKDTNIEIYEGGDTEKLGRFLIRFADLMNDAINYDFIGKPLLKIIGNNLIVYLHDMPSCNDSVDDCFHFYRKVNLKTLEISKNL